MQTPAQDQSIADRDELAWWPSSQAVLRSHRPGLSVWEAPKWHSAWSESQWGQPKKQEFNRWGGPRKGCLKRSFNPHQKYTHYSAWRPFQRSFSVREDLNLECKCFSWLFFFKLGICMFCFNSQYWKSAKNMRMLSIPLRIFGQWKPMALWLLSILQTPRVIIINTVITVLFGQHCTWPTPIL